MSRSWKPVSARESLAFAALLLLGILPVGRHSPYQPGEHSPNNTEVISPPTLFIQYVRRFIGYVDDLIST